MPFAPTELGFIADPYPTYAELRQAAPVLFDEPTDHWLVSRYDDVNALLRDRRFGRIVNVTSYSVKMPIDVLCLSNGSRAGLTGFIAGLAREVAAHNVTINNLLPGVFATARQEATVSAAAKNRGISLEEAKQQKIAAIPAGRMGEPDEFGDLCAYLCSARAGYFTGQNVLLDGGLYPGTF
jgi:3-oxoacyl-[acyl-carrier protein] reductase